MDDVNYSRFLEDIFKTNYTRTAEYLRSRGIHIPWDDAVAIVSPVEKSTHGISDYYSVDIGYGSRKILNRSNNFKYTFLTSSPIYLEFFYALLEEYTIKTGKVYMDVFYVYDNHPNIIKQEGILIQLSIREPRFVLPEPEETEGGYESWMM